MYLLSRYGFVCGFLSVWDSCILMYPTDAYTRHTVYRRVSNLFDYSLHVLVEYKWKLVYISIEPYPFVISVVVSVCILALLDLHFGQIIACILYWTLD